MKLRKDDPIYYRDKLKKLIEQAKDEGLKVSGEHLDNGVRIYFKASNGDTAGVGLTEN
jgi:hypothetical protein